MEFYVYADIPLRIPVRGQLVLRAIAGMFVGIGECHIAFDNEFEFYALPEHQLYHRTVQPQR